MPEAPAVSNLHAMTPEVSESASSVNIQHGSGMSRAEAAVKATSWRTKRSANFASDSHRGLTRDPPICIIDNQNGVSHRDYNQSLGTDGGFGTLTPVPVENRCGPDREDSQVTPVSYTHLTLPTKRIV